MSGSSAHSGLPPRLSTEPVESPKVAAADVSAGTGLVIEIGGTNIRAALCTHEETPSLSLEHLETPNYIRFPGDDAGALFGRLLEGLSAVTDALTSGSTVNWAVVAYPGPITPTGKAIRSPTILGPALDREIDILHHFRTLWPEANVFVLNDLLSAGYFWVARGHRDFCVLTVGSGIGNKVFVGGMPAIGVNGRGGEIGHLTVRFPEGTPLAGMTAELGAIASGRGTLATAQRWIEACPHELTGSMLADRCGAELRTEDLAAAFRADDALARRIVAATAAPLAHALAGIHLAIGIERFFLTGGFAKALGEGYRLILTEAMRALVWDVGQDWERMIEIGADTAEEGLLGARYYGLRHACAEEPKALLAS